MANQADGKKEDRASEQAREAQAPEFAPTRMHEPDFAATQMHGPEFAPTHMHEPAFAQTRVEGQEFEATQMLEPEFEATQVQAQVDLGNSWSEATDGRCSENAALFAASQTAPLSVV